MTMGFGISVTAIGVGLVFAVLLAVMILSKVLVRVFKAEREPVEEAGDEREIAAVTAVIASMDDNCEYGGGTSGKGVSRWEAAAKMEAMERGDE
jgi:Na+-transporting methylmalonyl-CoA/oxaloacetate decarboxylase gamma subunit